MSETTKPKDVQISPIASETTAFRSRTWDRLKFEVEYSLQKGTTENSFLIQGDKTALVDPPDRTFTEIYLSSLQQHLDLKQLDYVILGHFNAEGTETLKALRALAPQVTFICSNPAAIAMAEFFKDSELSNIIVVRGEETLDLGSGHELKFIIAPTPRWPDGMLTYDPQTEILFSDKFFGAHLCSGEVADEAWEIYSEERRFYYDCLHAAQAKQVLAVLDKISDLSVKLYAPGHGPMVRYGKTPRLYRKWSEEQSQQDMTVALLYASAYGNTATIAQAIARGLSKAGVAVDSINCEAASAIEIEAAVQKCDGFIIGSPTLGGHAPTQIQTALGITISTASKNKLAGVFGSYGWSGEAIDTISGKLKDAGYKFGFEPIRVKFTPDDLTLQQCEETGIDFARSVKKAQKHRAPKSSASVSHSDSTVQAVGRLVGSLCVLSAKRGNVVRAMLASWVSQATFNPPGLTVSIAKERVMESLMHTGDKFIVNILSEGNQLQKHFMKRFAPGEDRLANLSTDTGDNGCPILTEALAYLECTVHHRIECGDHWVIYGVTEKGQVLQPDGISAVHHRKSGSYYWVGAEAS